MPPAAYFFTSTAKCFARPGVCEIYFTIVTQPTFHRPACHVPPNGPPCYRLGTCAPLGKLCADRQNNPTWRKLFADRQNNSPPHGQRFAGGPTTVPIRQEQQRRTENTPPSGQLQQADPPIRTPTSGLLQLHSLTWYHSAPCAHGVLTAPRRLQPISHRPTATARIFSPHGTTCPRLVPPPAHHIRTTKPPPASASMPVAPLLTSYTIPARWLHHARHPRAVPVVRCQRPPPSYNLTMMAYNSTTIGMQTAYLSAQTTQRWSVKPTVIAARPPPIPVPCVPIPHATSLTSTTQMVSHHSGGYR